MLENINISSDENSEDNEDWFLVTNSMVNDYDDDTTTITDNKDQSNENINLKKSFDKFDNIM